MIEISNTDMKKILTKLPVVLKATSGAKDLKVSEAVRQLKLLYEKLSRKEVK